MTKIKTIKFNMADRRHIGKLRLCS